MARARLFRTSPVNAYLRLNERIWKHLPPSVTTLSPLRSHARFLHRLVRIRAARRQYFGTYFIRNRPELALIRRLVDGRPKGSILKIAFLACSNGAEVYSVLWTIRTRRPDLTVIAQAVDVSREILHLARNGVYSLDAPELVEEPIFARMTAEEMRQLFDVDPAGKTATIKAWLKDRIVWHLADAASPVLVRRLSRQDIVLANNFLCHMDPPHSERCLRNIAAMVERGGHLFVSGVDLDVRTRVAVDLGWRPVRESMEAIHDGDPSLRRDWPWEYWGLEPLDKTKRDWEMRYASVFQLA